MFKNDQEFNNCMFVNASVFSPHAAHCVEMADVKKLPLVVICRSGGFGKFKDNIQGVIVAALLLDQEHQDTRKDIHPANLSNFFRDSDYIVKIREKELYAIPGRVISRHQAIHTYLLHAAGSAERISFTGTQKRKLPKRPAILYPLGMSPENF